MEIRPRRANSTVDTRGSGPGARKRRSDNLGPRKVVILRMPEDLADKLKIVASHERTTSQNFCMEVIIPHIEETWRKHGLDSLDINR